MVEDSDDDEGVIDAVAYIKRQSARKRSPELASAKKPRFQASVLSDEEDDCAAEDGPRVKSFSQRLTKYQKSPTKKSSKGMSLFSVPILSLVDCPATEESSSTVGAYPVV